MIAREAITTKSGSEDVRPALNVEAGMPLIDVLPRLLEAPGRSLGVVSGDVLIGEIDERSLLEGLGKMIAGRDDSSVLTIECEASDFSASRIAMAVEDADVHLVDMLSRPSGEGMISVTLRVRTDEPSSVMASLRRHGFEVTESASGNEKELGLAAERLLGLQVLMNV